MKGILVEKVVVIELESWRPQAPQCPALLKRARQVWRCPAGRHVANPVRHAEIRRVVHRRLCGHVWFVSVHMPTATVIKGARKFDAIK